MNSGFCRAANDLTATARALPPGERLRLSGSRRPNEALAKQIDHLLLELRERHREIAKLARQLGADFLEAAPAVEELMDRVLIGPQPKQLVPQRILQHPVPLVAVAAPVVRTGPCAPANGTGRCDAERGIAAGDDMTRSVRTRCERSQGNSRPAEVG